MALDMTQEERAAGKANFEQVTEGLTRRDLLKSMALGAGAIIPVSAAIYFGYKSLDGKPVKAALIGAGDEGGVLAGEHNPEYLEFVAVCDIRPYNQKRIYKGEGVTSLRKGFNYHYGSDAEKNIKLYKDYQSMLDRLREDKEIEAVVIALPLHWHAKAAIDVMKVGQDRDKPIHVLCEKLMAWNIGQCKKMIQVAKETNSILHIGHQRHYSMLYAHALELINSGALGDVRHIRALWHRNNTWPFSEPKDREMAREVPAPYYRDGWTPPVWKEDYDALHGKQLLKDLKYNSVEELVRWRLGAYTGGGLMAELGSHQLDACSIFLGKIRPLAVTATGGKYFYGPGRNDRECDDTVFCTYEFPGKNYDKEKNPEDKIIVTYSSINTNSFEAYGECVMGSRGTLIVEAEREVMLYAEKNPAKRQKEDARSLSVTVAKGGGGKAALETSSTWGGTPVAAASAGGSKAVSRGYREEMEDFAYCIRLWDPKIGYETNADGSYKQRLPRCHGEVAMADAIVALTANIAMNVQDQTEKKGTRIVFEDGWFSAKAQDMDKVPDTLSKVLQKPKVPAT